MTVHMRQTERRKNALSSFCLRHLHHHYLLAMPGIVLGMVHHWDCRRINLDNVAFVIDSGVFVTL